MSDRDYDTGYYYANAVMMAKIAMILEKEEDAKQFLALSNYIKSAFRRKIYNDKGLPENTSQAGLSCILYQGLVDVEKSMVFELLLAEINRCNGHIDGGILGAKYIMQVLTDFGRADVA